MRQLLPLLSNNPAFKAYLNKSDNLGNLTLSEEALMIANTFFTKKQAMLIVKNNAYTAQKLYERLTPLVHDDVLLFSVEESHRVEAIAASPQMLASEIEVLSTLQTNKLKICITHTGGYTKYLPDPAIFNQYTHHIKVGDTIEYEHMKQTLFHAGYSKVTYVDQPLCFASRGGIIDVFSMNYEHPIRIEFFDNEIESIRYFDIATKRTIETIDAVDIIPASDFLLSEQHIATIKERAFAKAKSTKNQEIEALVELEMDLLEAQSKERHLSKYYALLDTSYCIYDYMDDPFVVLSSKEEVRQTYQRISEENIAYIQELQSMNMSLPLYNVSRQIDEIHSNYMSVGLFVNEKKPILSGIEDISYLDIPLDKKIKDIVSSMPQYALFFNLKEMEKTKVKDILTNMDIPFDNEEKYTPGIHFVKADMVEGFIAHQEKIAVYTSRELFDVVHLKNRYANKFKEAEVLQSFMELENGDFIVHKQYGVGKYIGIVNKLKDNVHKDYLRVVYKGNDELLVPLEQFQLIRKFMSKEGATPKLNKLGSGDWEKTKAKVSESVRILAQRLVQLYSLREKHIGFAFSKDTPFQREFEDDFDYPLTQDQDQAIQDIKRDMEQDVPMDRLLCGDVGFGKTEVAFRAIFKAIMDNKQGAFLCPTTILSQQHFKTAIQRFSNFPINIRLVNRFVSSKEMKQIKSDVKEGRVDLLIGTHRLLSKDIVFKELGLLIIDEEQRFGVEHKEKIKELKHSVDVLSLSATPIPRTLQMSLIGIRALSQLNTPPKNRVSVQTYVIEKNWPLMKEVMERELSRNGQVFYLFNNVKEIYRVATRVQKQLKDVKVGVAHGQMSKEEIEDVMMKFTNKEYQVLVCTTIIETGIDIANANTIIIEDADRFGLSQLYQIKGRVGRSDRLAYAYLMYAPQKQLSEIATKRLKSMKEFTTLGSGYKIAMRDLTIRGAGDMLGPKQAGFIDSVGMDMYIEMLNEAIQESKGESIVQNSVEDKKSNLSVDAYIPHQFEEEDYQKLTLYQRLDAIQDKKALLMMQEEMIDTYGTLPKAVCLLFEKKCLDIMINEPHIDTFSESKNAVTIAFTKAWSENIDGVKLFERATTLSPDIKIRYTNEKIQVSIPKSGTYLSLLIQFVDEIKNMKQH